MSKVAVIKPQRRTRNPEGTRASILEAACQLLAKDGPEGLSVSEVAHVAGVNRGTVYQHFQTQEQLLQATTALVSEKLCEAVFGAPALTDDNIDPRSMTERLAEFVMDNPELGRIWLFEFLGSSRPSSDPFWKLYRTKFDEFAKSALAQPGIDVEAHSVPMLIGAFLWPVWARAHASSAAERRRMAKRFSSEMMRLSLYGTMRADKFPELNTRLGKARGRVAKPGLS